MKVRESYFDSMSAMMSKLRSGIEYDVIFPTAEYVQRLIQGNQVRKIDRDKLKNADLVYPPSGALVRRRVGAHDSLHDVCHRPRLPRRQVPDMTGSWRDLGEADSGGKAFMLDDFQEGIGMANQVNGHELNAADDEALEQAKDYLLSVKPNLRGFSSDTITTMTSGNANIQHLWNGDIVNIRNQVDSPEDFKFQKSKEGIPVGSDTLRSR